MFARNIHVVIKISEGSETREYYSWHDTPNGANERCKEMNARKEAETAYFTSKVEVEQ
jgi:hypothetical protein